MVLHILRIGRSRGSGFSRGRILSELHFERIIGCSVEIEFERARVNDNDGLSVLPFKRRCGEGTKNQPGLGPLRRTSTQ